MPIFRPATIEDAIALSQDLRIEDEAEVRALTGKASLDSLIQGVNLSDLPVAIVDDEGSILGLFGAVTVSNAPRIGVIWMLASPKILTYRRQFAKESRHWVEALQAQYDLLCNVVDERNTVHIRWLQWCGFTFIRRHPEYGASKIPFLEFVRMKHV